MLIFVIIHIYPLLQACRPQPKAASTQRGVFCAHAMEPEKPPDRPLQRQMTASRHATLDKHGEEIVRVNKCCIFFVRFPWAVALISGILSVILSAVGMQPVSGLSPKVLRPLEHQIY